MKDNLSDILYILLVLLVPLLSSLTKARRKKSMERGQSQDNAPSESRLESFFKQFEEELTPVVKEENPVDEADDFIPREGVVNAEPEYQDSMLKEVMARQASYQDMSDTFAPSSVHSVDEAESIGQSKSAENHPDTGGEPDKQNDILASLSDMDILKRAVIYKEILDPKY